MRCYMLERACEVELVARQLDAPPIEVDPYVVGKAAERMKAIRNTEHYGRMEWEGLVRTVDRIDADYRR
jgi:hypothetical protein